MPDGGRVRLRVFVGGELADELWVDPDASDEEQRGHIVAAQTAADAGLPWMVELHDPSLPPDQAYMRFGTDPRGMLVPLPLPGPNLDLIRQKCYPANTPQSAQHATQSFPLG